MSKKSIAIVVICVAIVLDQILKIWVKTNFMLGESFHVCGNWFILHFVENPGMALGFQFGGQFGKILLTIFRIVAAGGIFWYLMKWIKKGIPMGLTVCVAFIIAGAIGNALDSTFYGLVFDRGTVFNGEIGKWVGYGGLAQMGSEGYTGVFRGCVVDMFYFPIIRTTWPSWMPFVGGDSFEFFRPVFNLADSYISVGIIAILIFYHQFFSEKNRTKEETSPEA